MMCYKDQTFCKYSDCRNFLPNTCGRAFNEEAKAGAKAWMGDNAPVAFFAEPPKCYDPVDLNWS